MLTVTPATMHDRTATVKYYARRLRLRSATDTTAVANEVDEFLLVLRDHPNAHFGELHELKQMCRGLEERLNEPPVGQLCDTSNALQGKLFDLRDEIRRSCV